MKDIQINDETTRRLLAYVNPVFADAVNVSGVANFHCEQLAIPLGAAELKDLEVIGTISMKKLRFGSSGLLGEVLSVAGLSSRNQNITVHPTRFVLRDGFLRYDDMQMDVGDNPVNFKGVIGLDRTLDMTVILPYTTRGKTVRVGRKTDGKRIALLLRGTLDKPELDLANLGKQLLEDQLTEKLKQKIKEELGEELGEKLGEKALEILEEMFK